MLSILKMEMGNYILGGRDENLNASFGKTSNIATSYESSTVIIVMMSLIPLGV